ncbi:MAG TPA: fibronectin type III domain-containing protein [Solirubrobacteraceae bacterium]|jgi:hypothetical protein
MRRLVAATGGVCAIAAAVAAAVAVLATPASAAVLATPSNVTATEIPDGAIVYFDAPSPPPGVFYTYTATASPGGEQGIVSTDGPSPGQVSVSPDLTNGQTYTFTVVVSDDSGDSSAPSAPSNPVTPELTVPDAVTAVSATGGDGQATVSFQDDGNTGGAPLSKFTVTASPGGAQASASDSPITVTGLHDGTPYTFTVVAKNSVGDSPTSAASAPVTPLPAPSLTTEPTITGTAVVGQTVSTSGGVWNQSPGLAYQWYDCAPTDAASCTLISGATAAQYIVAPQDEQSTLEVVVTATNADGGSTTATSAPTAAVPLADPSATTLPEITGTAEIDDVLHASSGAWAGLPDAYNYQWLDCDDFSGTCTPIDGATANSYVVGPLDGGSRIAVAVTATNDSDGESGDAQSGETDVVSARSGAPVLMSLPTIGPVIGTRTVTATAGTWDNSPTSFVYQWLSCASDLSSCDAVGDDSLSYTPQSSDLGHVLLMLVVATNAAGDSLPAFSEESDPVGTFPPPVATITAPEVGISFSAGSTMTAEYSCTAGEGTTLVSCDGAYNTSQQSPITAVANGSLFGPPIGDYDFVVTAVQSDGQTSTASTEFGVFPRSTSSPPYTPFTVSGAIPVSRLPITVFTPPRVVPFPPIVSQSPPYSASGLKQAASRWRPGKGQPTDAAGPIAPNEAVTGTPVGTSFTFVSTAPATVDFVFSKREAGHKRGKRCVAGAGLAHAKRCTRSVAAGSFTLPVLAGNNVVSFGGALSSSKRLSSGAYVVSATATATGAGVSDESGSSLVGTLEFTIVK